jgi:hypothetical protein
MGRSTPIYLSGGAAVVLAYGSTERTKDVDAFFTESNEVLDELEAWAGKNTAVAKREGYFFEVVPPIYPAAPGMFERALPIQGLNLRALDSRSSFTTSSSPSSVAITRRIAPTSNC